MQRRKPVCIRLTDADQRDAARAPIGVAPRGWWVLILPIGRVPWPVLSVQSQLVGAVAVLVLLEMAAAGWLR